MKKVLVIMSTYNGGHTVVRQLNSIMNQKGVNVTCFIRDDGSTDKTISILHEYKKSHPNVLIREGRNVGWERSFMMALKEAPHADYYAFSDQDDIWFENKLSEGVKMIDQSSNESPILYHCNKISVDEKLKPLSHQVRRTCKPLNHQNAMVQEYAQGCSIIMNNKARDLVTSYIPKKKISHDFWCGLLCYLFGEVIYDDNKYFYHISYGNNASGEGHMVKSWIGRLRKLFNDEEAYYSPCKDLIEGLQVMLSKEDKSFCAKIIGYKENFRDKLYLFFSPKFIRDSLLGTVSLKLAVLCNKL